MTGTTPKAYGSPRFALLAVIFAGALVLAAGGLLAFALQQPPGGSGNGILSSAIGGPFHLTDQNGKPFTQADLKGKWHLVFFGYTHCPDVCPTTLNELSLAIDKLDPQQRKNIGVVFVSVDPERDTPAVLKSYVESFDAPITGLSGSAAEVKQVAADYHVYYAKHERADGGYDMDHSAVIYVMDPQGRFTGTITPDTTAPQIQTKLQKLLS
jgi:protein SCO1/2